MKDATSLREYARQVKLLQEIAFNESGNGDDLSEVLITTEPNIDKEGALDDSVISDDERKRDDTTELLNPILSVRNTHQSGRTSTVIRSEFCRPGPRY